MQRYRLARHRAHVVAEVGIDIGVGGVAGGDLRREDADDVPGAVAHRRCGPARDPLQRPEDRVRVGGAEFFDDAVARVQGFEPRPDPELFDRGQVGAAGVATGPDVSSTQSKRVGETNSSPSSLSWIGVS